MSVFENPDLFAISPDARPRITTVAPGIPAVIVDDFYQNPREIRAAALAMPFGPPTALYPGRMTQFPNNFVSLNTAVAWIKDLVDRELLTKIELMNGGKRVTTFRRVETDFAIVDTPPEDLLPAQRAPHVDHVPIFGLVYLNEVERGGTAFFRRRQDAPDPERDGYFSDTDGVFQKTGRIEGKFNRLAIYPGFIWHSAEIGDWIKGDERLKAPRLTQRLVFHE